MAECGDVSGTFAIECQLSAGQTEGADIPQWKKRTDVGNQFPWEPIQEWPSRLQRRFRIVLRISHAGMAVLKLQFAGRVSFSTAVVVVNRSRCVLVAILFLVGRGRFCKDEERYGRETMLPSCLGDESEARRSGFTSPIVPSPCVCTMLYSLPLSVIQVRGNCVEAIQCE
jgi:hypothetical protein